MEVLQNYLDAQCFDNTRKRIAVKSIEFKQSLSSPSCFFYLTLTIIIIMYWTVFCAHPCSLLYQALNFALEGAQQFSSGMGKM